MLSLSNWSLDPSGISDINFKKENWLKKADDKKCKIIQHAKSLEVIKQWVISNVSAHKYKFHIQSKKKRQRSGINTIKHHTWPRTLDSKT